MTTIRQADSLSPFRVFRRRKNTAGIQELLSIVQPRRQRIRTRRRETQNKEALKAERAVRVHALAAL